MLAKNSQAPRSFRTHALSLTFFASKNQASPSLLQKPMYACRGMAARSGLVDDPAEQPQAEHQPDDADDDRGPHKGAHGRIQKEQADDQGDDADD